MDQPWIPIEANVRSPAAKPPQTGLWKWVKRLVLLPFRIMGLICVLALLLGGPSMWIIPDVAARHGLDMSLVVLRVLDDDSPARPLRRLGYQESIQAKLLELRPDGTQPSGNTGRGELKEEIISLSVERKAGGHIYSIRYAGGKSQTVSATTPHTTVSAEELTAARKAVSRFYSPQNTKEWARILAWGESLFVSSWVNKYDPARAPRERFVGPPGGTEEEQVWCVWQVLRCGGAPEEDLAHLPELFAQAFPDKQDQEQALAWSHTLYERLTSYFIARKPYFQISSGSHAGHEGILDAYFSLQHVLPPSTDWTHLWLLQQYVGLSPAAREAARLRWLKCFPASREQQVLEWGAKLIEERREKGEALPNVPDVLPALCVLERLTGTDADGQATHDAVRHIPQLKLAETALMFAYPNDDLFYVLAAGNRLDFYPSVHQDPSSPASYYLAVLLYVLAITSMASLGVQTALGWLGRRVTGWTGNRHLWDKRQESRGEGSWWLSGLSILVCSYVGYLMAPSSLPEAVLVQIDSPAELFYGALMATAIGGFLITTCRKALGLFLITFGVDVEKTWADEILGILFGGYILYHFGNDFLAIGIFALSDLAPGLVQVGFDRLRKRGHAEPRPEAGPAVRPVPRGGSPHIPVR
jgi:hypothetical protein